MKHRFWKALRWRASVFACLVIAMVAAPAAAPAAAAAPTTAAPATIAFNTTNAAIPLLLVHGYNDDCATAWDTQGTDSNGNVQTGIPNSKAHVYLSSQFSNIVEVGYYTITADPSACTVDLNSPTLYTQCNALGPNRASDGTRDDPLERVSCLLAWYIYDKFTQYGQPVNVLAHSMGGLLIRYALGATAAHAASFPPVLWVNNVVTVATPHGGIWGAYHNFALLDVPGLQLDEMNPGDPAHTFMSTIGGYQRPQGYGGTRWALMGATDSPLASSDGGAQVSLATGLNGDGVVPATSQLSMTADYKIEYGVRGQTLASLAVADQATQYEHETMLKCYRWVIACFNGPYFLNDSSTASTSAWTCVMCGGDEPPGSPVSVSRSLAVIASQLQQKPVPNLPSQDLVFRSNANGYYVSAELGYGGADQWMLRARAATKGAWESWTRVQLPTGHWAILSNAAGQYVSAELGYGGANYGELRARTLASAVSSTEVFDFVGNADGTYSVRSLANGLYVSAELGYTGAYYGELRARASAIGAWEKFNLSTTGGAGCVNYGGGNITGPDSCAGTFSLHSIWYSGSPLGLQGRERWTWANGTVQDSTATWQLSGLSTLYVVEIDAFIPNYHSNAQHVHYTLCAPGNGCSAAYVNQSPYYDQWTVVGYVCTTDGTATVTLADDGGDYYPRQIAADAVQGVRTGARCYA